VFNFQLAHREVLRIARRQRHSDGDSRSSDQAVRLRQRCTRRRMLASPVTGLDAFKPTDWRDAQAVEQADRNDAFGIAQAPMDLLDVDRRRKGHIPMPAKRSESLDRSRAAPQHIDQHRRIQKDAHI